MAPIKSYLSYKPPLFMKRAQQSLPGASSRLNAPSSLSCSPQQRCSSSLIISLASRPLLTAPCEGATPAEPSPCAPASLCSPVSNSFQNCVAKVTSPSGDFTWAASALGGEAAEDGQRGLELDVPLLSPTESPGTAAVVPCCPWCRGQAARPHRDWGGQAVVADSPRTPPMCPSEPKDHAGQAAEQIFMACGVTQL